MRPITKPMIKTFLFSGLFFAGIIAAWDYYDGKSFQLVKFIFMATFNGFWTAYSMRHNNKKSESSENKEQQFKN